MSQPFFPTTQLAPPILIFENCKSFNERLDVVIEYLHIYEIYCKVKGRIGASFDFTKTYEVSDMWIPGGEPPYVKSKIKELLKILSNYLLDKTFNPEELDNTGYILRDALKKCDLHEKQNDIDYCLEYDNKRFRFYICSKNSQTPISIANLNFSPKASAYLTDHLKVRKEFFIQMKEYLFEAIEKNTAELPYTKQPWRWKSDNPHLEIAELANAIYHTRIEGKSADFHHEKEFVRKFFDIFGYDSNQYHQKLHQIRERKLKKSWINELIVHVNSLQQSAQNSKQKSNKSELD